jgi:hypothetical protein
LKKAGRRDPHCESCNRQWFGPVTFCPYCGRRAVPASAGAAAAAFDQPAIKPAPAPEARVVAAMRQRRPLLLKAAAAGAVATLLVWTTATYLPAQRATLESRQRPATTAVMGAAPPAAAPASAPQPAKPSASAVRSRLLCSAADAASGLCKWQE